MRGKSAMPDWTLNALLRCLSGVLLLPAWDAAAREFYFSPSSLEGDTLTQQDVDLSLFSRDNAQLPGTYPSRVMVNTRAQPEENIRYLSGPDGVLQPQLTPAMLRRWGVQVDNYPVFSGLADQDPLSEPLGHYLPFASATFDFASTTLRLSIPQAALSQARAGDIDPASWQDGVPVLFADYALSGSQNEDSDHRHDSSQYLNLRSGLNLGGWRVRNYSTWSRTDDSHAWDDVGSWIQHDVDALRAQFTAGDNSTRGDVFDSVQYRGVNLASDDEMLPYSQRGYAPVIQGVASSNAEVSVRQNGYLIYQQNVAPGAFEIRDLNSTTNSGDLEVSVKEADGTVHSWTQPYSSVAVMQRPGQIKYELTAARYRADNDSHQNEPLFAQGSAIYGLNNALTLFGGVTASQDYQAVDAGIGMVPGELGSISFDVTWAGTTLDNDEHRTGQSYRVLYSGKIDATDTNFTLASYRYSTAGYYSFADANQKYDEDDWTQRYNKRSRIQASISQTLFASSLYLNGYQQDYWGTSQRERSVTAGLNHVFGSVSAHLACTYSQAGDEPSDRMVSLGFSVPLSAWLPGSWASYSLNNSRHGDTSQSVGINGTLLDDQRLSYSFQQSHTNHDGTDNSSVYSSYRSQYAYVNAGYYAASDDTRRFNYGASGAIVAHPHGVTLAQPLGEQFAIVSTNGASGVRFRNQRGVQTDAFGNAVIPSLTPYQQNTLRVDTTTLPEDVDTDATALTLIPSRRAAVAARFEARIGYRVLSTLTQENGHPVPFGALASVTGAVQSGIVDEGGVLYLAGIADRTDLSVQWGAAQAQRCRAQLIIPAGASASPAGIRTARAICYQETHRAP